MKKLIAFLVPVLCSLGINSQNTTDALRYSLNDLQGTARFRAMSGAFGALGGDLSAINLNPAGSAIFNASSASFSFGYFENSQDISYFGSNTNSNHNSIDINQAGGVFVMNNVDISSPWKKFTIAITYDRLADFDNDLVANGINPNTSVGSYFLANAQGKRLDEISAFADESFSEAYAIIGNLYGFQHQQAFLGYESFIIDPLEPVDSNTGYFSNVSGGNYTQRYLNSSRGSNGKVAFNLGTQYKDFLSLGLNLNTHFLRYERLTSMRESNTNFSSLVKRIEFRDNLFTTGSGFSFQMGAIAKITQSLRVGLTYDSPTWYYLNDETTQFVSTLREGPIDIIEQVVNPNIVNFYPRYRLQTPGKLGASLAYVIGTKALLSFDYSFRDYGNMRYSPSDAFFSEQNAIISNTFTTASSYRFGGEYRLKQLSLRGGYRIEESPYRNNQFFGDLEGYSFGLGYTFGAFKIDGSFSQSKREFNFQLYDVGLTDTASVDNRFTDVIITLSFLF